MGREISRRGAVVAIVVAVILVAVAYMKLGRNDAPVFPNEAKRLKLARARQVAQAEKRGVSLKRPGDLGRPSAGSDDASR